jgi:hypothetical protein
VFKLGDFYEVIPKIRNLANFSQFDPVSQVHIKNFYGHRPHATVGLWIKGKIIRKSGWFWENSARLSDFLHRNLVHEVSDSHKTAGYFSRKTFQTFRFLWHIYDRLSGLPVKLKCYSVLAAGCRRLTNSC